MRKKLYMNKIQPIKKMGKSCETREIRNKKVIWPYIEKDFFDGKFKSRVIGRADIDRAAELWRISFPDVYGSSDDWIFYPEEYERRVALRENWEEDSANKADCMLVMEEIETGKLVSAAVYSKDDKNLSVEFTIGAIHPDYRKGKRGSKFWIQVLEHLKRIEEDSGAEYMTVACITSHDITQHLCLKRLGFKVAGIFPGQFTRWCGEQKEYRGCEVHFYKFIGDGEKFATKAEEWTLLPELKKLWDVLEEINKESDDAALREYIEKSK